MTRNAVITTSAVLLAISSGCSTTKASTTVQRAPWISFKGAKTIRLDLSVSCVDVWQAVARKPRESRCSDGGFTGGLTGTLQKRIHHHLSSQGYQVVHGGSADHVLRATVNLRRERSVEYSGERTDDKNDKTCQTLCSSSKCYAFQQGGGLHLDAVFIGPMFSGKEQTVERKWQFSALSKPPQSLIGGRLGTNDVLACDKGPDSDRFLNEKHFDWSRARADMERWLAGSFERMLAPYREEYEVELFEVDTPECERGVAAAKIGDWKAARAAFQAGYDKVSADEQVEPEVRARLLYNVAAAEMTLGMLDVARRHVVESNEIEGSSEAVELADEIDRRRIDREKL